jgi:hypothetical protein
LFVALKNANKNADTGADASTPDDVRSELKQKRPVYVFSEQSLVFLILDCHVVSLGNVPPAGTCLWWHVTSK